MSPFKPEPVWSGSAAAGSLGAAVHEGVSTFLGPVGLVGADVSLVLCIALRVPVAVARMTSARGRTQATAWEVSMAGSSTVVGPTSGFRREDAVPPRTVLIPDSCLVLAAVLVLAVDYLDGVGRAESVTDDLRGLSSMALLAGLEVRAS